MGIILQFSVLVSTFEVSVVNSTVHIFPLALNIFRVKLFTCVVWFQEYLEVSFDFNPPRKSP